MSLVDCPALNQAASQVSDLAAGLNGAAMNQVDQLQSQVTALQDQVTQLHDQAMAQVAQAENKVTELQDQMTQLHDQAMAQAAALQSQAMELHDQALAQVTQAQSKVTDLQSQASQLRDQTMARVTEAQSKVADLHGQASQLRDQALARVTEAQGNAADLHDQASQLHDRAGAQLAAQGGLAALHGQAMAQLQGQAASHMAELEGRMTELQDHATRLQDEATSQMTQLQSRATALHDQATQLQDRAKTQLAQLHSQAQGRLAALRSQAAAAPGEAMAQLHGHAEGARSRVMESVSRLHGMAAAMQGRADELRSQAQSKAGELHDQAMAHATGLRDQATAQASGLRDQARTYATGLRDQARAHASHWRDSVMSHVSSLRSRVTGLRDQATQLHGRAMAQVAQLQSQASQMRSEAIATGTGLHDEVTGALAVPPAVGALMQESAAHPLPEKERCRESDLAPFADEEGEAPPEAAEPAHEHGEESRAEDEPDGPAGLSSILQAALERRLKLAAARAAARAQEALQSALGGSAWPGDMPDPHELAEHMPDPSEMIPDEQSVEDWAHSQVSSWMSRFQQRFQPPPLPDLDPHLQAPPYDDPTAACLAGMAQTNNLMQDLLGKSILDGPGELQELVGSFQECAAAIPSIDPSQLGAMNVAGAMAMAVESVRNRFNVDLLAEGAGTRLAGLLSQARSLAPSGLQEAAAQRVAKWLPLAQFAGSVKLPLSGAGALARVGEAARWMHSVPMPDTGMAAKQMSEMMGHMNNADAVKRVFNVNPFSKGAGAALAPMLSRVRDNAHEAMSRATGAASQARGIADNLSRSSVAEVAKIDRGQAKDLALGRLNQAASPVLTRAAPVLSTLSSVRQATGKVPAMPGSGRWRR